MLCSGSPLVRQIEKSELVNHIATIALIALQHTCLAKYDMTCQREVAMFLSNAIREMVQDFHENPTALYTRYQITLLCAGGVGCIDGWGTTEVGGVFFV